MLNGETLLNKSTNIAYEKIHNNDLPVTTIEIASTKETPLPDVEKHWHYDLELIVPLESELDVWMNGETSIIERKHLAIINSAMIHSVRAHVPYERDDTLCFQINYDFIKMVFPDFDEVYLSTKLEEKINDYLVELLLSMYDVSKKKTKYRNTIIQGYLMTIIGILLENQAYPRNISINDATSKNLNELMEVVSYIDKNHTEQINIEELAKRFGFSYGYLARSFKKNFNVTIKQYITMVRLEHCLNDLIYTNVSITKIALNNGFPNLEALNREFYQKYKMTPLQYRKKVRK